MISILNRMPDEYEPKSLSYPEIKEHLESRVKGSDDEPSALFAVKEKRFDHIVGLAGVVIDEDINDGKTARVIEIAVHPRARGNRLGALLLQECIEWSREHDAEQMSVEVLPEPESAADKLLRSLDFEPDPNTEKPVLQLSDA